MGGSAWVTLATNDSYSLGALVLAHSLRQVGTTQQLVVLVTPGVTAPMREKLSSVFNVVQEVNILDSRDEANLRLLKRPELGVTFTKLHCWRLTQFDKCVFLDADTLVLQNCDELFERDELSAAPDVGWPDCFNSGVFVYRPSNETYTSLVEFAIERGSFDGGDQGLLNLYFSDWAHKDINKHLPFIYNLCSTACYSYLPAFKQFGGDAKIIHFIGNSKPWLQYFDTETQLVHPSEGLEHLRGILQHWWSIFCSLIHPNLTPDMARSTSDVHPTNTNPEFFHPPSPLPEPVHDYRDVYDPWDDYIAKPTTPPPPSPSLTVTATAAYHHMTEPFQAKPIESHNTKACSCDDNNHKTSDYSLPQFPRPADDHHNTSYEQVSPRPPLLFSPSPQSHTDPPLHQSQPVSQSQPFQYHQHQQPPPPSPKNQQSHLEFHSYQPVPTFFQSHQSSSSPNNTAPHQNIPPSSDNQSRNDHNPPSTNHNHNPPSSNDHHKHHPDHSEFSPSPSELPEHNFAPVHSLSVDTPKHNEPALSLPSENESATATVSNESTLHINHNEESNSGGLAGAFAQLTLGAPRTPEQRALDDHLRRQGWEVGNIDYLGKDSFDKIWSKICETLATPPPTTQPKEPTPPLTEVQPAVETVIAEQAAAQETQISQTPPAQTPQETDSPAPPADSLPSAPAVSSEIPQSEPQTTSEEAPTPEIPLKPASLPAQSDVVPPEATVSESSETQAPVSIEAVPAAAVIVSTDSQTPSTPTAEIPTEAVPVVEQAQSAVPETIPVVKESAPIAAEPAPAVSEPTPAVTEQTLVAELAPETQSAPEAIPATKTEISAIAEPSPASVEPQVSAATIPAVPVESVPPSTETPTAPVLSPTETPAVSSAIPVEPPSSPSTQSVAEPPTSTPTVQPQVPASPQTPPSPQSSPQVCPIVPKTAPAPPSQQPPQKDSTPAKTAQSPSKQSSAQKSAATPPSPKPETQQAPPLQCTLPSKSQAGPGSPKVTAQEAQKSKPEEKTQESSKPETEAAPAPQSPTGSGPTPPPRKASGGQKKTTKPKK